MLSLRRLRGPSGSGDENDERVEGQEVGGHGPKNSPQLLPWNRSERGRCDMLVEFKQQSMFGLFGRAFRLEIRECQDHFPRALREKGKK